MRGEHHDRIPAGPKLLFDLQEKRTTDSEIITHLYLSHEHPDHFHIPSLKNLISNINFSNVEILCKSDPRTKQDIVKILKKVWIQKIRHPFALQIPDNSSPFKKP